MSSWPEVVTTSLLGTTRRPVPETPGAPWAAASDQLRRGDPARRVLDLAAAHAGVARLPEAGSCSAPPTGPPQQLSCAPTDAGRLLSEMVRRPEPAVVNLWLQACARHGFGLPPEHWTVLVRLAARSGRYDRDLLATCLGERGRWFVSQNPEWRRVAADLHVRAAAGPAAAGPAEPAAVPTAVPAELDPKRLDANPELILDLPDPWPDPVVAAAFRQLGGGRPPGASRSYAVAVGARLPARAYPAIGRAAEYYLQAPDATPARRRAVRAAFVALEQAAYARLAVDRVFDPELTEVTRISIPAV